MMILMSKNVRAFVFLTAVAAFGVGCASGEPATEGDLSAEGQALLINTETDDESSDTTAQVDERNVAVNPALSSDSQLQYAPTPQPWNEKKK